MGVQALYFSDRDGKEKAMADPNNLLFTSKKEADERDKMLEFSDELRVFLERRVEGIGEKMAEQCALVLAQDRELLARAVKKPELLNQAPAKPDQVVTPE